MTTNDTLSAALSKIDNATKAQKASVSMRPYSTTITRILTKMQESKYVGAHEIVQTEVGKSLTLHLIGQLNKCGAIKPRHAVAVDNFEKWEKRFLPAKGFGILFVSTNQGILTHEEAKAKRLGGRLLAYCY